jgi:hypothetical protein
MSSHFNNGFINYSLIFCFPESSSKERQDVTGSSAELCRESCSTDPTSNVAYASGAIKNVVEFETRNMTTDDCGFSEGKAVSESETAEKDKCVAQCKKCIRTEMPCEHCMQQEAVKDLAQKGNNLVIKNSVLSQSLLSKEAVRPHRHGKKHRHHRRKYAHREEKGALFEGERVSYLVGQCEAKEAQSLVDNREESSVREDEYVLRKLFKKSGESFTCKMYSCALVCSFRWHV